jgi:hypothetical protein
VDAEEAQAVRAEGLDPDDPARSCNYLLHLATAVLDDQVKQGNIVRNVARLVDRVAAAASSFGRVVTTRDTETGSQG